MKGLLIVLCVLVCLAGIGLIAYTYLKKKGVKLFFVGGIISALSLIVLILVPAGIYEVDAGEAALVKEFGNAKSVETAGLKWRFWIKDSVTYYDLKVQEVETEVMAYSQDAQTMSADVVVQYRIMADKIIEINKEYGMLDNLNSRLQNVFIEKTKVVLASASAMSIIENRDKLSANVMDAIAPEMEKFYVTLSMVSVNNIDFNDAFESAVEQKMIAEQQQLQAEYDKKKAIIKAEEELEVKKLEAEAVLAASQADAESIKLIANAQAESIRLKSVEVARMLGFTILEDGNIDYTGHTQEEIALVQSYLKYAEYLEKWDGKLPTVVGDSTTVVMPPVE
ncbi:MAG: prohibitin family protein [Anaeroplasmataceae bacterium]